MSKARNATEASTLVEGLFRHESARLVASLTRLFGPNNIDLVEDVVQETLETALQAWKFRIPENPRAWLTKAARNRVIDVIRHQTVQRKYAEEYGPLLESSWTRSTTIDDALASTDENQLRMMLSLCHQTLSAETHVTLILKFLCGFGTHELAAAFLTSEETIKKRVVRGLAKFRKLGSLPAMEAGAVNHLSSLLGALYLLFNEGYHGSHPTTPTRRVLCDEAMRLCTLILRTNHPPPPEAHALMALMYFHSARIDSRMGPHGDLIPLTLQDRFRWDTTAIAHGVEQMGFSATGQTISAFHLEAGIACKHCLAPSFAETDWPGILELYELLHRIDTSPVVSVIREVARAYAGDPGIATEKIVALQDEKALRNYPFYWAARAEIHTLNGDTEIAQQEFEKAAGLARNTIEEKAFNRKASELQELQTTPFQH